MKKATSGIAAVFAAGALVLAGCAQPPSTSTSSPSAGNGSSGSTVAAKDFKACMVSDFGGFEDKSFNETALAGMTKAAKEFGIQTSKIESKAESEYTGNVQEMVDQKCSIVITVGFALAKTTQVAAEQHQDVHFAIVDSGSVDGVKNLKGLVFNAAQPAFMAGYTAASITQTGTVGTFGGAKYPSVTIFMDGFAEGVAYYNQAKGASVKVIGWNEESQDGQFIDGGDPFGDVSGGKNTANTLISQGADVILPVAGPAGEGALQAAQESGGKVKAIWVDSDGFLSSPKYKSVIVTSVMKGMDTAVYEAIKSAMEGSFSSEEYVGTLDNGGASLAPFHDFDSKISDETKAELEKIKKDIISGAITLKSSNQP